MSSLYLVRHGQASFGSDDYDRLSDLGREQCERLARHWTGLARATPLVYSGALRRQRDSAAAFAAGIAAGGQCPQVRVVAGLEEYDHEALVAAFARHSGGSVDPAALRHDRRAFHRHLVRALEAWATQGLGDFEPYAAFRDRCAAALVGIMGEVGRGRTAIVFGSAGSLAAGIQPIIGLGDWDLLRLKFNFYNTGVIRLLFNGETSVVESFNSIAHLEQPGATHLITQR